MKIDWLLALPHEAELAFRQQVRELEEEQQMPYITSIERIGRAEGHEEGREEGKRGATRAVIAARFGAVPEALSARIAAASESELDDLLVRAAVAPALDDL